MNDLGVEINAGPSRNHSTFWLVMGIVFIVLYFVPVYSSGGDGGGTWFYWTLFGNQAGSALFYIYLCLAGIAFPIVSSAAKGLARPIIFLSIGFLGWMFWMVGGMGTEEAHGVSTLGLQFLAICSMLAGSAFRIERPSSLLAGLLAGVGGIAFAILLAVEGIMNMSFPGLEYLFRPVWFLAVIQLSLMAAAMLGISHFWTVGRPASNAKAMRILLACGVSAQALLLAANMGPGFWESLLVIRCYLYSFGMFMAVLLGFIGLLRMTTYKASTKEI